MTTLTVHTPMPAWYDPLEDDAAAAEAAVRGLAALVTDSPVAGIEHLDITDTLDGTVWTWLVHLEQRSGGDANGCWEEHLPEGSRQHRQAHGVLGPR